MERVSDEMKAAIAEILKENGCDPIQQATIRLSEMDKESLIKIILIAANRIGLRINGGDYGSPVVATKMMVAGVKEIMAAFDGASMDVIAQAPPTWGVHSYN